MRLEFSDYLTLKLVLLLTKLPQNGIVLVEVKNELITVKKKNVISLIKYYVEKNDVGFRNEAYEIAKDFDTSGDYQLAEYIMSLLSNVNTFVPQMSEAESPFFEKVESKEDMLILPDEITNDLLGVVKAIEHNIGINKFLFQGKPGTGKTKAVKQLARILGREIYMVDFASIIDSKLDRYLNQLKLANRDIRFFRKIMSLMKVVPYQGDFLSWKQYRLW